MMWPAGNGYVAAEVELEWPEFLTAVDIGMRRFASSSTKGDNHASTYKRDYLTRLEEETVGACGEMVFCKWRGMYFNGSVDTYHTIPDVNGNDVMFEIRSTKYDDGCLIVRDNDADDRVFVLVTGRPPKMTVRGWMLGRDAKQQRWLKNPNGYRASWFVPQPELNRWNGT